MIDIIKESELKPIVLDDLKVDKLFVFYAKCNWNNNYIYTITKIDEHKLYFKDIGDYYTESNINLNEVNKYIILLDNYADEKSKSVTDFKNVQEVYKRYDDFRKAFEDAERVRNITITKQKEIHNKTKQFSKVLRYADKIKLFMDAALVYYEPENLSFRVIDEYFLEIAIKFPDITITNSRGKSHNIKDLLVFTTINLETMKFSKDIEGYRGSLTPEEVCSQYNHSHLRAGDCNKITKFCLGSSEMAVLVAEMKSNTINSQKFEFYCGSLDQYVRWESLEGIPYIEFSSIHNNSNILNSLSISIKEMYYNSFIANKIPFKLVYESLNEKFKVNLDLENIMTLIPSTDITVKVIKNGNNYYNITNNSTIEREARNAITNRNTYYFDGVKKPELYIPVKTEKEVKYYPHPDIVSYIQNKLEEETEKHLILTQ